MAISRIYSIAPANAYTGGPTALHQLCYFINKTFYDVECLMAYAGISKGIDPVHPEYRKYKVRWIPISRIEDSPKNLLIIPETQTYLLHKFKLSRKAIYWLSIDNFFLSIYKPKIKSLLNAIEYIFRYNLIAQFIIYKYFYSNVLHGDVSHYIASREISNTLSKNLDHILKLLNNADLHIAQSKYAKTFLTHIGIDKCKIPILREPIEDDFYNININQIMKNKNNIISFNARKSFSIVYRIIRKVEQYNKNIRIVPLKNVGKERMIRILSKSKVFIDIGHHPGRDRPAREAGALGNIIIANRSGGYYYFEDLPIPDEYAIYCKDIACRDVNEGNIVNLIMDAIENYEHRIKKFSGFMEYIRKEPKLYLEDLKKLKVLIEQL